MPTQPARDSMNVYVDDEPVECTAFITDKGYDLDLLFNFGDKKGHIYSDVEGSEMTNYLLFDGECIAQEKQKNLKSNHKPDEMKWPIQYYISMYYMSYIILCHYYIVCKIQRTTRFDIATLTRKKFNIFSIIIMLVINIVMAG